MSHVKYIIHDKEKDGYASDNPIEGWIFTTIKDHATQFDTQAAADLVIIREYSEIRRRLEVRRILVID